jgi:hypothetical protein
MKKSLIIPFIVPFLVTAVSLCSADETTTNHVHKLAVDRHAAQKDREDVHNQDLKPKSKYDLRDLGGDRRENSHKHVHNHGRNHDRKAKSRYDLRNIDGRDHRDAHRHDHGHAHKHDLGDAHKHKHGAAHVHDHGDNPGSHDDHSHAAHGHDSGSHDDHGHQGHGHDHGHGGHEHGYDRVWDVGISG